MIKWDLKAQNVSKENKNAFIPYKNVWYWNLKASS